MPEYTVTVEGREYDVDAPDERTAYRWGQQFHAKHKKESGARQQADIAAAREASDPLKEMSGGEKALANIGAGMHSAWTGLKQILPGVKGPTDEEVRNKREADDRLAAGTDLGIGSDWLPTAGKALQVGGEILPTLAIPAGAMTGVGAKSLPRAMAWLLKSPTRAGAVGGAASGALMPTTSDESRAMNVGIGAGAGAALPAAMGAYRFVRDNFTNKGARVAAGRLAGVTPDSPLPADPATLGARGAENVPLSTASLYGDDALAAQEVASRARTDAQAGWRDLDKRTGRAVWENVEEATQRAGTEAERRAERSAGWRERSAEAAQGLKPRVWQREMKQLRTNLAQALRSPEGQNEMRPVLMEMIRQMDELGPDGFTPQHLAQLRSRMSGSVKGSPVDPFTSAPRSDPAFISIRDEFDRILNAATGDRWERVLEGYRRESVPVAQAKAETFVKDRFQTPEGVPKVSTSEGVPNVTEHALRRAITLPQSKNTLGNAPTFAPDSERVLKGTLEALERQQIGQRAKRTMTGGGGSPTQPLMQLALRADPTQSADWLSRAVQVARNLGHTRALRELDEALMDPQRYYQIVNETIRAGRPLSDAAQFALKAAAQGLAASSVDAAQQAQPQPMQMR